MDERLSRERICALTYGEKERERERGEATNAIGAFYKLHQVQRVLFLVAQTTPSQRTHRYAVLLNWCYLLGGSIDLVKFRKWNNNEVLSRSLISVDYTE